MMLFIPYSVSKEVRDAFAENSAKIGVANPFDIAADAIANLEGTNVCRPKFKSFQSFLCLKIHYNQ